MRPMFTGTGAKNLNHGSGGNREGFTLLELVAVLLLLFVLSSVVATGLARTHPAGLSFQCQNRHRQLVAAWSMYTTEYGDRVANNLSVQDTAAGIINNWVNNVMTWNTTGVIGTSTTNLVRATNGLLGKYIAVAPIEAYKCPSDTYLSEAQIHAGWQNRLRSVSMNFLFGISVPGATDGRNYYLPDYQQFLKVTQVPKPVKTWLFVDEHPDSINNGCFVNDPTMLQWQDIPSSLHEGGCTFSFVDGHAELKRWQSPVSVQPIRYSDSFPRLVFDAEGRQDFRWYLQRTGFINGGLPYYGY